jgi:hypothetical protein
LTESFSSFTGTSIPVNKDGKQEAQAKLELKLAATGSIANMNGSRRCSGGGEPAIRRLGNG